MPRIEKEPIVESVETSDATEREESDKPDKSTNLTQRQGTKSLYLQNKEDNFLQI